MKNFEAVYETMLGLLEPEAEVPGVKHAFIDGSLCEKEYEAMRQAYGRICLRLGGSDEDKDLDCIVESMEKIQKELCRRMFDLSRY